MRATAGEEQSLAVAIGQVGLGERLVHLPAPPKSSGHQRCARATTGVRGGLESDKVSLTEEVANDDQAAGGRLNPPTPAAIDAN